LEVEAVPSLLVFVAQVLPSIVFRIPQAALFLTCQPTMSALLVVERFVVVVAVEVLVS
jgi:hypothetical protein